MKNGIKASEINYGKEKKRIKKELEDYFDDYTSFPTCPISERYRLVSALFINDVDMGEPKKNGHGIINDAMKVFIDSNSMAHLELIWNTELFKMFHDTTFQHFIADMKKRKVVKLLSICI